MDYKYIEQLLERYWECATTLEEEQILRSFFNQKDVPVQFIQYKDLFTFPVEARREGLGEDFDAKMMALIEKPSVEAKRIPLFHRFRPFLKAAAAVSVVLLVGSASKLTLGDNAQQATDGFAQNQMLEQTDQQTLGGQTEGTGEQIDTLTSKELSQLVR